AGDGDARPALDRDAAAESRCDQSRRDPRAAGPDRERNCGEPGEKVPGGDAPGPRLLLPAAGYGFRRRDALPAWSIPAGFTDRGLERGHPGLLREARARLQGPLIAWLTLAIESCAKRR